MGLYKITKKNVLICLMLFMHTALINAQGIEFKYGKWDHVLQKAKKENKLIFVDVFTTWCAPCKAMSKNIFPLASVGEYFNEHFINFKIDAERGEGVEFAKTYSINAYPSLLLVDTNGEIVNKNIGVFNSGSELIEFAKKTLENRNDSKFGDIKNRYAGNKSDFNNFKGYVDLLSEQGDIQALNKVFQEFADKYAVRLPVADTVINFLKEYKDFIDPEDNFFKHLSSNFDTYSKIIDLKKLANLFKDVYINRNTVDKAHRNKKIPELITKVNKDDNLEEDIKKYIIARINLYKSQFEFETALNTTSLNYNTEEESNGIALRYRNNLVSFVEQYGEGIEINGQNLVNFARGLETLHSNTSYLSNEKEDKQIAKRWWLMAVEKDRSPVILSEYANLIFRESYYLFTQEKNELSKEKRKEAIKIIEEAVQKARLNNPTDNQLLERCYQVESFIKKGHQIDAAPTLYQLQEVLDMIRNYYVDPVSELFNEKKYITYILSSLDAYSRLVPYDELNRQSAAYAGDLGGVGMKLNMIDYKPVVVRLTANAPAYNAGIRVGDIITEVDGENFEDMQDLSNIINRIIGKVGSSVFIKIKRGQNMMDFNLKRKALNSNDVAAYYMINGNSGYIKLGFFGNNCHQEVKDAIQNLKSFGMTQLILDLTDNPGGVRDEAIKIADEFIDDDKVIVTEENKNDKDVHKANPKIIGSFEEGNIIVMINENSASASELLSGALQDHDRAYFVGRKSFGKGLVQGIYGLNDGTGLVLTNSRFLFPSGRCPQITYPNKKIASREELIQSGVLRDKKAISFTGYPEFKTTSGRTVYGNCGVMPEVFVPLDIKYENNAYQTIKKNQLIFRFVADYLRNKNNQKELQSLGQAKFTNEFEVNKLMWQNFVNFSNEYIPMPDNIEVKDLVKNEIKAEIIRHLWNDSNAYQKILNSNRKIYLQAIRSLKELK